ncbi:hypothetical protein D3C72_2534730 [compost metagenome]
MSVAADQTAAFEALLAGHPVEKLGTVTAGAITIGGDNWGTVDSWKNTYDTAIEKVLAS